MYLNKNWYCLEFDLTGSDLGFTTRFWISMTELFVTMNSFMIAERNRNQWIYQWICDIQIIWKLSYLILPRIIVFFNSLNTELCWLYSFFLYWLFPNFILEFLKNMIEPPTLQEGSYKISPVHLSICLSKCLWCIFLRIYSAFFKFFAWGYFIIY